MGVPTDDLKREAERLGFWSVGITPALPSADFDAYRLWISRGMHADMDYLARHVELKADPRSLLPSARTIVAVALGYNQPNPYLEAQPRIARYALGRDYHKVLRGKLAALARWIARAYEGAESRACVDSAPILERSYAHSAGLGWFGKNTCLIDSKRGSWFFIGLLLTSVDFTSDAPAEGGCGTCQACIDACPTGAIVFQDGRWAVDSRRCISYITIEKRGPLSHEEGAMVGEWTFGCDVCQEVCPFNTERERQPLRGERTREPDFLEPRKWPSLTELATLDEEAFDALTRGSATRRAGLEGLRRNAKANLRNRRS